jgi:phage anti-repressor protein
MTIQWEKRIKLNFKSTSTLYTSNYTYNNLFKTTSSNWILNSSIKDYGIKQNLEYIKNKNRINFGYNSIYYITEPKTYLQNLNNGFNNNGKKGIENILYFNNDTKLNKKISLEYGFRFNLYTFLNDELLYDFENNITQVKTIESNNKNKNLFNIEPRISSRFDMGRNKYLKFAVSRNVQHLHLLNNANIYEQWIANSDKVLPEIADQISLGLEKWSKNNFYELNVDIYYKNLQNQIDFKESIGFNSIVNYENTIAYGIGRSYGLELKILKHDDIFSGWISYGLSKSEKLITGINNNNWYNNIQDRRHSISFLTMYKINRKINISSVFIYYSGSAITYPIGRYTLFDQNVFLYGQRNVNRTPSYHRLDLSFNYDNLSKKKIKSKWNFTIYNVYGRENPYRINFKQNPLNKNETMIVQTALFKWVPSINYSFNF